MHETVDLVSYRSDGKYTYITLKCDSDEPVQYAKKHNTNKAILTLTDGRVMSSKQRMKIYACIGDIAEYIGDSPEQQKEIFKYYHMGKTGCDYFSLKDCSMDCAREFINTLLDFCLENGIPLKESYLGRTDDIDHYLWKCLQQGKCCICGKEADIPQEISANGCTGKISLCYCHESELKEKGQERFTKKYKVYGVNYNGGV